MIVKEVNDGAKIDYSVRGSKITINDEIMLNLERYERDDANHIDVCRDAYGNLVTGVIPGIAEAYVAQIDIPPRAYVEIPAEVAEVPTEAEETADSENGGGMREQGPTLEPVPFDMAKCTLSLWAID